MHGSLPGSGAGGGGLVAEPAYGVVEHGGVVGVQDRLHRKNLWMSEERRHGAEDHRLPTDRAILLRPAGASAESAAGGNENGCGFVRLYHGTQNTGGVRTGLITPKAGKQRHWSRLAGKPFCCTALAPYQELVKV